MWLALCWILESAERDRSLNFHLKGAAFHYCLRFLARARAAPRPAVSIRRRGELSGRRLRERIETAGRGGLGVCALWHFRLGDRALDPWACGRRTARGEFWSPVLAAGEAAAALLFGL